MKGFRIFLAIVLAVTAPVMGARLIYGVCVRMSFDASDILLLLKGLVFILTGLLAVVGIVVYCMGVCNDRQRAVRGMVRTESPKKPEWTPEHPKPQTVDWDNGHCPYTRDSRKPLGTKENPVVVGMPESSTHLVFSGERGCWILTDGLGNGWIR